MRKPGSIMDTGSSVEAIVDEYPKKTFISNRWPRLMRPNSMNLDVHHLSEQQKVKESKEQQNSKKDIDSQTQYDVRLLFTNQLDFAKEKEK